MDAISFTWNEQKNKANQQKHGISFNEAQTAFYDEYARLLYDAGHSTDENRFILLGLSRRFRLLVVVHCYREDDEVIRIISARKATKSEQNQYEEFVE